LPFIHELRHQLFIDKGPKSKALGSFNTGQGQSVIEILSHATGHQCIVCVLTVWNEDAVKLNIR
jgi:hypothetical protein